MTSEQYGPPQFPRLVLHEGDDFIDGTDVYAKITDELIQLGADPEAVVFCGHNDDEDDNARVRTYAMSLADIQSRLRSQAEWTPYDYARDNADAGSGLPTITVYDGASLQEDYEHAGQLTTVDDGPLSGAIVLEVTLSVWR